MSIKEYRKALRLGSKAYHAQLLLGKSPYLPVLEQMMQEKNIAVREQLGVIDIPLERISGTYYYGREQSFTLHFLPIMNEDSEFALKWSALCDAHITEGIHEPIKAFEYMNQYYVTEGHKRVSVLRHFGAASIRGDVTRLIPNKDSSPESQLYFAYLDFYRLTSINYVWFSKKEGFSQLLQIVKGNTQEAWTSEEQTIFRSFFRSFSLACREKLKPEHSIPAGDAMLLYLNIYDYTSSCNKTLPEFRKELAAMQKEFSNLINDNNVHVQLTPNDRISLFSAPPVRPVRMAFLHEKCASDSSWVYAHELGRMDLEAQMGSQVETLSIENAATEAQTEQAIKKAADWHADLIFTTSPYMLSASVRGALDNPRLKILNCSLNTKHPSIRTYYVRMYEAKFLMGVIAGSLSEGDIIEYIADYPIYGFAANINAFALGAQLVNPRAKILLTWSTTTLDSPQTVAPRPEVSYVSDQDSLHPNAVFPKKVGLYRTYGDSISNIALPFCHWGKLYESFAKSYINRSLKNDSASTRPVNYWLGMDSGVVDLICTRNLPAGTRRLVELLKHQLCNHAFSPFADLLFTQSGEAKDFRHRPITPEELITMDWLVSNVIGTIPQKENLTPKAQSLVAIQGVVPS